MKPQQKTLTLWILVILIMALVAKTISQNKQDSRILSYSKGLTGIGDKVTIYTTGVGENMRYGMFQRELRSSLQGHLGPKQPLA